MPVPENDAVSWDAFWKFLGACALVISGAFAWLMMMVRGTVKAHQVDDDHRFAGLSEHLDRVQTQAREDVKEIGERMERRVDRLEEKQDNQFANVLNEIRNNRK